MPNFSRQSVNKLQTCHPELQKLFFEVIKHWDCIISEGHRGEEAQNSAVARGKSKLLYPHGRHNSVPSMAVDVYPYPVPTDKQMADYYYFGGFVLGVAAMLKAQGVMRYSVRYGADWNKNQRITDEKFIDAVHFELILLPQGNI